MRVSKLFSTVAAGALVAGLSVGTAAPALAIPADQAVGDPGAYGGDGYGGYSTGTILFLNAFNAEDQELARISLAQSAAGAVVNEELVDVDLLGSQILFADEAARAGKNAYGHGAGLNVGLGGDPTDPAAPQGTFGLAEALSPPPSEAEDIVIDGPPNPLLTADVLEADAVANTTSVADLCDLAGDGSLISEGVARAAGAAALDQEGAPPPLVTAPGESVSTSQTLLVGEEPYGLTSVTTQTLADLVLLDGTPLQTTIDVLADIQLRATATGEEGGAEVFYGFIDDEGNPVDGDQEVVEVTVGTAPPFALTSDQVFGDEGFNLNLGVLQVQIGGPAFEEETEDGTRAFGTADFIRVLAPADEPIDTDPVAPGVQPAPVVGADSPLAPVLNPLLTPIIAGAEPVLTGLQAALDEIFGADGTVLDLAYGHLEALAVVPAGGIVCVECDPLADATKTASATTVAPGQEFQYVISFTNGCADPLTGVSITDTFAAGLEYRGGTGTVTPAGGQAREIDVPDTAPGNVVTIPVGDVPAGASVRIVLSFRVPADAADGQRYRNDADITGTFDGEPVATRASVVAPTVDRPAAAAPLRGRTPAKTLADTGPEGGAAAVGLLLLAGALVVRRRFGQA